MLAGVPRPVLPGREVALGLLSARADELLSSTQHLMAPPKRVTRSQSESQAPRKGGAGDVRATDAGERCSKGLATRDWCANKKR